MKKRLPPYGRQILVPALPYLMVFVGEPECWQHCAEQRQLGFRNNLCLPDINDAGRYDWPVRNLHTVVILFNDYSAEESLYLVNTLAGYHPKEIAVRNWPEKAVISYQEDAA